MNNKSLLFFKDYEDQFTESVRCCILKYGIPFDETEDIHQAINQIQSHSVYAIMCVKSPFVSKLIDKACELHTDYFVKTSNTQLNCEEILSNFIQSLIYNKQISITPRPLPLAHQIIRNELEKLHLSKKYIGFKYVSDIIIESLKQNITDAYTPTLFKKVAIINQVTEDSVERDIRHMLMKTWKNCPEFKAQFTNINKQTTNSKELLNNIISYIRKII